MINLYNHTNMPSLILWILLLLGSSSLYAQSPPTTTQDQMRALGFEPVDLPTLRQTQTGTSCSSCPHNRAQRTPMPPNPAQELAALRQQLPTLQQRANASQRDSNTDPAMRQKHQLTLSRAQARIRVLEQQLASNSLSPEQ